MTPKPWSLKLTRIYYSNGQNISPVIIQFSIIQCIKMKRERERCGGQELIWASFLTVFSFTLFTETDCLAEPRTPQFQPIHQVILCWWSLFSVSWVLGMQVAATLAQFAYEFWVFNLWSSCLHRKHLDTL